MERKAQLRVYTDGNCRFCWWARGLVEPYDTNGRVDFRDFNVPEIAAEAPYSRAQLAEEMHVATPDGSWYAGFWGWVAVLEELPRLRWLSRILRLPPMRWVGPGMYRFVARNRYRIPEWLLRLIGAPRPCDTSCEISPLRKQS